MSRYRFVQVAVVAALLTVLSARAWADPGIGSPAPATTLADPTGHRVTLGPTADGVLVVDFFATWCLPCHEALAALEDIARAHAPHVRLVVVAVGEDAATVQAFFARRPLAAPSVTTVLLDPDGTAARAWGQHRFPTTFLVGGDGTIRHINRGYGPGYPLRLRRWIDAMRGLPVDPPARGAP